MKPHLDIAHEGNLGDEGVTRMEFDAASTGFLMRVLTDLYQDPAAAVVREYAANARDSHAEAGNPDPIRVYLPTTLAPVFTVKDFGTGMSRDTIEQVYSKYGASTKRNSDAVVGMLGLGCKSALSYASQFTLISVQDGIKCTVLLSRDADGTGTVQILDESATDEPNGVEVQIPVSNSRDITDRAIKHFRYWDPGTVLINDAPPTDCIWTDEHSNFIDPDVVLYPTSGGSTDIIVMGSIAYPIPHAFKNNRKTQQNVIARVPIGAVDFTPSRDALHTTDRTKEVITEVYDFVQSQIHRSAQTEINAAPNHLAAIEVALNWKSAYYGIEDNLTYKWAKIPLSFESGLRRQYLPVGHPRHSGVSNYGEYVEPTPDEANLMYRWRLDAYSDQNATTEPSLAASRDLKNSLHVVGYPRMGMRSEAKEKIKLYIEQHPELGNIKLVYAYKRAFGSPWLDAIPHVDWAIIREIKLPTTIRTRTRTADWRIAHSTGVAEVADLDPQKSVVWLPADARWETHELCDLAGVVGSDVTIVVCPANRLNRLKRERPDATEAAVFIPLLVDVTIKNMPPERAYMLQHGVPYEISIMPSDRVFDLEFRALVQIINAEYKHLSHVTNEWNTLLHAACRLGDWKTRDALNNHIAAAGGVFQERIDRVNNRYPMLTAYHSTDASSVLVEYVNAMYLMREGAHLSRLY